MLKVKPFYMLAGKTVPFQQTLDYLETNHTEYIVVDRDQAFFYIS